jgi:hypothetical protein
VICTPPIASGQVGFTAKTLKEKLLTVEDIPHFDTQNQVCQVYAFDRVINDMFQPSSITKLFNKVIKNKTVE